MTSAFLGGTLSWSQLRLLTRVARLHNEKEWIRKAAGHGMRELEELVGSAPHDTRDTGADAGDDKPTVPWSVRVSREARRLWRAAVELAGRSAGEPLSAARALELLAAEAAGSEAARRPGATPAFSGDAAVLEWLSVPRHRDPVFERDGWRCTVPACSSRRNLHDHHVEFRSHGGGNGQGNRVTVCAAHHLHGIHTGRIRAAGTAPHAIVWEMPFGRLLGDRYQRTS